MQSANTAARATAPVAARIPAPVAASPSPQFLERFFTAAETQHTRDQAPGELRFDHFMRLALYDESVGYYAQPNRHRVGHAPSTDFYTATSVGQTTNHTGTAPPSLFGELVVQSCLTLMGEAFCAKATLVEIGAECDSLGSNECGGGILKSLSHPFAASRTISLGQPIELLGANDTPLIVFSNELFDAQPCRRFVWREGRQRWEGRPNHGEPNAPATGWHEVYVRAESGTLTEAEHPLGRVPQFLPKTAPDGYRIDAPLDAKALLDQIAGQAWHGLFLAFDYGKSWAELAEATPQGSARAYTQHRQSNALLAQPGEQDLTCHVCWDWLQDGLAAAGFRNIALETQEAFFVKHSGPFIAQQIAAEAQKLSPRKQALLQLLHPAHLGQKFQVLSAQRTKLG